MSDKILKSSIHLLCKVTLQIKRLEIQYNILFLFYYMDDISTRLTI